MDPSFIFFLFLAVGTLLLLGIGLVVLLPKILKNLGGRGGGWTNLAEHFPATSQRPGELIKKQTVEIGQVVYKRCTTVGITPQGLYLEAKIPFSARLRPLIIPWEMIKGLREGSLYWGKIQTLSIGQPEIGTVSVFPDLFEKIRPYLIKSERR